MKVTEIAFFCYPVTDLKRARRFYEGTLALKETRIFGDGNPTWIEYDIGQCTLGIGIGLPEWKPSADGGSAALEVDDFDAAIRRLKDEGVTFIREPMETRSGRMALILDPDGNAILIHKRKSG